MKNYYYLLLLAAGVLAPFLLPDYRTQLAMLWVMVVLALSWDILGGQMGYNSFGNVIFFGIGMYACAVIQRDSGLSYYPALLIGMGVGGVFAMLAAAILGNALLGMRGHYFAIGTVRDVFFYFLFFAWAIMTFLSLRWLYQSRFGLAINAIRDDEDKAEAMGIHTVRYKVTAWILSALFLGVIGGGVGNLIGFIDPKDVAFSGPTFGVWMILMAITGGKGRIWGPVIGAAVFHLTQELFWTLLLGWQRVALGLLIILIVLFFPEGILGWLQQRFPKRFAPAVANDESPKQVS